MSLEARIAELNDNIKALISVMQSTTGAVIKDPVKQEKAAPEKKATSGADKAGADTAQADTTTKETAAPVAEEVTQSTIALQDVIDVTLALGKAGKRNQLVELLGKYNVPKSSALPPEQFASFHTAASALLEG